MRKNIITRVLWVLMIVVALLSTGACTELTIKKDVDYPAKLFKTAWKTIDSLHAKYPDRKGPASKLKVIVYVGDERQLITFAVPATLVRQMVKDDGSIDNSFVGKYVKDADIDLDGVDLKKLCQFERLGPGLVTEVFVADDNVHVLLWLE